MALSKFKIGDLIDSINVKCNITNLTVYEVSGINRDKEFFSPAIQVGQDTSSYKIVPPNHFACNLMHVGRDIVIPVSLNRTGKDIIVSPAYSVFRITRNDIILDEYLFMVFKKVDFDRYAAFCTDSSVRDGLEWNRFLDIELDLPSVKVQQKVVDVYLSMVENQKVYEKGLEDLKLTCDAYIENLRKNIPSQSIKDFMIRGSKNTSETINEVLGIGQSGFIKPQKQPNDSLRNYKIINKDDIVYAPPLYNILSDAIGCYNGDNPVVCSPIYEVFSVKPPLLARYLVMWLKRSEFKRYAEFHSGGVRNTFDYELMENFEIPIPKHSIQKNIVEVYEAYEMRKKINDNLKKQINEICPVLIKGSIDLNH